MSGSTADSDRLTRQLFHAMKAELDTARAVAAATGEEPVLQRLRLATDTQGRSVVDWTKADRGCTYCGGTGRRPDKRYTDEATGEERVIRVVCRCVVRNGGVVKDQYDRMVDALRAKQGVNASD